MQTDASRNSLTAMMCDGLGWFSALDFKRALLVFDRIEYLLPADTVAFTDRDGDERWLAFPVWLQRSKTFTIRHFSTDSTTTAAIVASAQADAADRVFRSAIARIAGPDRLYAWRVASADATFAPIMAGVAPDDGEILAHALLLNRFLLAADDAGQLPISGQSHIRTLLAAKLAGAPPVGGLRPTTAAKLQPVSLTLADNFIADGDLASVPDEEILAYKEFNTALFRNFVAELLQITAAIKELPSDDHFAAALNELRMTDFRRRQNEITADLRDAWIAFFKTALKGTAAALLSLGIIPGMPLTAVALTAASASATWALPDLVELLARRHKVRRHGMYYLMNLA